MSSGLRSARFPFALAVGLVGSLPGCFLDHGRGDPGPDPLVRDAAIGRDAAFVRADVGPEPGPGGDAGDPLSDVDAGTCTLGDRAVTVRVEAVTTDVARCQVTHVNGMFVHDVVPVPEEDGVRVRADFCPDADADCRCDIVIGNVGTDVAPSVLPGSLPLTLDLRSGAGPGTYVAIEEEPHCRCDGCACSLALVLYAADISPDFAPHLPPEIRVAQGAVVCPDLGCESGTWNLSVGFPSGNFDVPAGTTRDDGAIHVRSIRDIDVFQPCAACAGCSTPHGSWVAWAEN